MLVLTSSFEPQYLAMPEIRTASCTFQLRERVLYLTSFTLSGHSVTRYRVLIKPKQTVWNSYVWTKLRISSWHLKFSLNGFPWWFFYFTSFISPTLSLPLLHFWQFYFDYCPSYVSLFFCQLFCVFLFFCFLYGYCLWVLPGLEFMAPADPQESSFLVERRAAPETLF